MWRRWRLGRTQMRGDARLSFVLVFFFSSRRRHTRFDCDWSSDVCSSDLGRLAHVNLIPLTPTPGSRWDASPKPVEREFVRRLRAAGVPTTVRDTRGREIDGACGQLAAAEVAQ